MMSVSTTRLKPNCKDEINRIFLKGLRKLPGGSEEKLKTDDLIWK